MNVLDGTGGVGTGASLKIGEQVRACRSIDPSGGDNLTFGSLTD